MRYAIVSDTFPPEINGVALTLQSYIEGLRAHGHTIDIIRPAHAGGMPGEDHAELRVRSIAIPRYPGLRLALPARRRLLARWCRQRPDAVYIATEGPLGWSALSCAATLDIPAASALHTRFDLYMSAYGLPWLRPAALHWMRRFHARADASLVATRALAAELQEAGIGRPVVLARAVDCIRFDPARRDPMLRAHWGAGPDDIVAIHVGRLAAEKNLALAVRAFHAIQATHPGARMVFVGDGPERAALERAHPDIIFCGAQRDDALARHFASADLFLFPSRSETFGNVVLESMASGVAQVAFDHGAATEHLVDGEHGARIPMDDESGFIAAAVRLAADPERRQSMGRAARNAMLQLTPAEVAAALDALLAGLRAPAAPVQPRTAPPGHAHERPAV